MSPAQASNATAEQTPLREMLKLCGAHLRYAIFFSALVNLAYLAPTIYMLQVYDRVVPSGSKPTLAFLTVALMAALILLTYLDRVRSRLLMAASVRLDRAFSARIFRRALSGMATGSPLRLNQLIRDFDTVRLVVTGPAALAVFDAPWIPIYIIVCFLVHPLIGALALGGAVLLVLLAALNERLTRDINLRAAAASAASYAGQESVGAAADSVRALGMAFAFEVQFEEARASVSQLQLQGTSTSGRIGGLIRFLRLLLQSIALGAGAWLAISKDISAGAIFASSMLAARALSPIDQIVSHWRALSSASAAYSSIREYLHQEIAAPATVLPDPAAQLSLQFVSALSPTRDQLVLNGISLELKGGSVVGVIGASGAGKTTLLQLIANARPVDQGEIRISGARYADWDAERLGRFIGYLPQDSALLPGTVKDNISRFDRWANVPVELVDQMAIAAARSAEVHDMILKLPKGYDTMLGPRGRGLSAGQQQRVALARALYGDPLIYVLDEPNSNADGEAEAALLRVIERLKAAGALVIVAAHRFSLISAVDQLAVLNAGRLEQFGPRDTVLAALNTNEPSRPTVAVASQA